MPYLCRRFLAPLTVLVGLLLSGCSANLSDARSAMNAVTMAYNEVSPRLLATREAEGQACIALDSPADKACLAEVRKRWAPVRAASEKVHASIIAALAVLHTAEAGEALGQRVDLANVIRVVLAAMGAVEVLRDLVAPQVPVTPALP